MNTLEGISIAFNAVWANKLRSALTILGNVISVAFIIAVVAGIQGINTNVSGQLMSQGANVFNLSQYGMIFSHEEWRKAQKNPEITMEDARAIKDYLGSGSMVAVSSGASATIAAGGKELEAIGVNGRSHEYAMVNDIELIEGRYIASFDQERRRNVVVLGHGVADSLFGDLSTMGRAVYINGRRYEVIGRAASKGSFMGESQDNWVEIPVTTFLAEFGYDRSLRITVKIMEQEKLRSAMEDVTVLMRQRHRLKPGEKDDFGIMTADAIMELYHSATKTIYTVLVAVVALSLVVGGIVIANIMLAVVNERTREIGVRKALGAKRRHILWQFLIESIALSLTGGVLGVAVGYGFAYGIRTWTPLPTVIQPWSIGMAMATVVVVGLLSGLGPALSASRLNPVEALRYE